MLLESLTKDRNALKGLYMIDMSEQQTVRMVLYIDKLKGRG